MRDFLRSFQERARAGETFDSAELLTLKSWISEDRAVSRAEAHALVSIKMTRPDLCAHETFRELYIETLTSFLLFTGETPGALDDMEFLWLSEHIGRDGKADDLEKALLRHVQWTARSVPLAFERFVKGFK